MRALASGPARQAARLVLPPEQMAAPQAAVRLVAA
jgi:hypothetical protein